MFEIVDSQATGPIIRVGVCESGWALWNSLWNGFRSARPLIPFVGRGWWGDWIRPRSLQ